MAADQSFLSAAMSNPYLWLIAFVLTAIGAAPGVVRIVKFFKSNGTDFFRWTLRRTVKNTIVSAVEHVAESPEVIDGVVSYYTARLSEMVLKLAAFTFNLVFALYVLKSGLEPISADPSWRFICIPFLIFGAINVVELWIVRFQIYVFRHALPAIREELEKQR